jgi:hypothetical protein
VTIFRCAFSHVPRSEPLDVAQRKTTDPSENRHASGYHPSMSLHRHLLFSTTALMFAWFTAQPAFAQDPMADIRRELAALRAEVQQLRVQVDALKGAGAAADTTPATVEILQAQVAELAQTKVESTSRVPVRVFGTVHANVFANSANANWLDNPNLVSPAPADGYAGTTSATLRQTRLGLTVDAPRIGSVRTNAVVAMDFFGGIPGFQTGQVMGLPRLLVAFARIEGERTAVEVGQDHMILAPRDSDLSRRVCLSPPVPIGQPLSPGPAGARRASAHPASARDRRHRRTDWR